MKKTDPLPPLTPEAPVYDARPAWIRWLYGQPSALPKDVTSRDLFKALALVLMVVDHIGLYCVDLDLLRAVGRCSMPLWLFLVGYSKSYRLPPLVWLGALWIAAVDLTLGYAVWPMRILFTIIVARLAVAKAGDFFFRSPLHLAAAAAASLAVLSASSEVFQYGTHGILFAALGYGRANMQRIGVGERTLATLMLVTAATYFWRQTNRFDFEAFAATVFVVLLLATSLALLRFRPLVFAGTDDRPGAPLLKFLGRRTLETYVVHLTAFKMAYWAWYYGYV